MFRLPLRMVQGQGAEVLTAMVDIVDFQADRLYIVCFWLNDNTKGISEIALNGELTRQLEGMLIDFQVLPLSNA